jgi:transaldolase
MEAIELIQSHGQSVWLDLASEDLRSDHFLDWIEQGWITGITSATGLMPESHLQGLIEDPWLRLQAHAGVQDDEILQSLLIESYRKIADILLPTFERTNGEDGFVSLDIDPRDVQDREAFLNVSLNVWNEVNRPNLLISIPATTENMFVLAESLERGVNVNASMVCSIEQYLEVVDIYFSSLEKRLERGSGIEHIVSTASFPIGLIDRHVNRHLGEFKGEGTGAKRAGALSDQVGLSIAKLAYAQFNLSFNSDRFQNLSMQRGRVQRLLWTGFSNNENVSAWDYIEQLIGPHTIIAPKLHTLSELHTGEILGPTVEEGLSEARGKLQALESIGISMPQVVSEIKASILKEQREAILTVLEEIHERRNKLECELKPVISQYREVLNELESMEIIHRVWQADTSLWGSDRRVQKYLPAMMGWLNLHLHVNEIIQECSSFIQELQKEDRTKLVMVTEGSVGLLVRALAYQSGSEANNLIVLDLFDPDQLQSTVEKLDPKRAQCVFIVGSHHDEMLHESLDVIRPIFHEANAEDPSDLVSLITYPGKCGACGAEGIFDPHKSPIPFLCTWLPWHARSCLGGQGYQSDK